MASFLSAGGLDLGDGSDGAVAFIYTGSTAVAGATLSSGVYTMTRDIFATSITLEPGVVLKPSGFRIRCQGGITNALTNGGSQTAFPVISDNGNAASATTGVAGVAISAAGSLGRLAPAGHAKVSPGGTVGAQATAGIAGAFGGQGGQGGAGNGNQGGQATAVPTALTGAQGTNHDLIFINTGILGAQNAGAQTILGVSGGTGGSSGGSDGTQGSGGGGGGGGVIYIAAKSISVSGNTPLVAGVSAAGLVIQANGGAGGTQTLAGTQSGGGGGGGGGVLILCTLYPIRQDGSPFSPQLQVNGGAGGAASAGVQGQTAGGAGFPGTIFTFSPVNF